MAQRVAALPPSDWSFSASIYPARPLSSSSDANGPCGGQSAVAIGLSTVSKNGRAEAVRDYLVRGDIAAGRIRTAGLGCAHPLSACRDDLPRAELISCLQPERRVEIGVGAGE